MSDHKDRKNDQAKIAKPAYDSSKDPARRPPQENVQRNSEKAAKSSGTGPGNAKAGKQAERNK